MKHDGERFINSTSTPSTRSNDDCFFFQAEDGIRDYKVTGVQTCALPISYPGSTSAIAGTSGSSGMRILEVTATGLICPARTLGSEPGRLSNKKSTRPPSRSVKAGPAPLYGMWVTSTPAMLFIISPERCKVVPKPADA